MPMLLCLQDADPATLATKLGNRMGVRQPPYTTGLATYTTDTATYTTDTATYTTDTATYTTDTATYTTDTATYCVSKHNKQKE